MTKIVFPVYNNVTQLDFTAPHQFFTVPDIQVTVASIGGAAITSGGLRFDQLADLEAIEQCDMLCAPAAWAALMR